MANKKIFNVKIILDFMADKMEEIAFKGIDHLKNLIEYKHKIGHPKTEEEVENFINLQEEQGRIEGQMEAYREMFEFITTLPLQDTTTHEA